MRNKWAEFAIGVFVLAGVVLAVVLVLRMDSFLFDSYTVSAYFEKVEGLSSGVSVRMAGYKIGQVSDIKLLNSEQRKALREEAELKGFDRDDAYVRVTMEIDSN